MRTIPPPSVHQPARKVCLVIFVLGTLFKLWLISGAEVRDTTDDSICYLEQILGLTDCAQMCPPGTGVVGSFFREFGIPFFLGVEVFYWAAAFATVAALIGWPHRHYTPLGLYLLTIFSPVVMNLNTSLLSDVVFVTTVMLGFGCLVLSYSTKRQWLFFLGASLFLGISVITRVTYIPLLMALAALAALIILLHPSPRSIPDLVKNLFPIAAVSLGLSIIYMGTCCYNAEAYGFYGLSMIDSSQYRHLYGTLQSVGDSGDYAYFPIDEQKRAEIRLAGPNAKLFIDALEKDSGAKQASQERYGRYDIASGWFSWAAYSVYPNNQPKSAALFQAVENDVAEASRQHIIATHFVLPIPDSRFGVVSRAFPLALENSVTCLLHQPPQLSWNWAKGPYVDHGFSVALTRRTISPDPVAGKIGDFLCSAYAVLYNRIVLLLGLVAFLATVFLSVYYRGKTIVAGGRFPAQQIFVIYFFLLFLWYTLFDASGYPVLDRYMIFGNLLLPIFTVYYVWLAWQIYCRKSVDFLLQEEDAAS